MNKFAEFSGDIQKLLLKKTQEFDSELKFISSQATEETSCFISKLIQDIVCIFEKLNIPTGFAEEQQKDVAKGSISTIPIVIQCYNCLLCNTHFPSQHLLEEDCLYGHLVDMCPALSPYLFIQIIWRLKYDEVLVESLQHIPLDLYAEILEITTKCLAELETERAISLTFSLINQIYCKCLWLHKDTLSAKKGVTECTQQLIASFQTLLDLLGKFALFPEISNEERYERHGILLKRILNNIRLYMCKKEETSELNVSTSENLYKLTYGDHNSNTNYDCTVSVNEVKSIMATLDQELIALLLNQIKQVDCFEYMGWAEIDDKENTVISLQRAIVIECYHFVEFIKKDEFLAENDHLAQCLQQLMGLQNVEKSILTLQELCYDIANGKPEDMKELLKRYKEWDQPTLSFISEHMQLLEKDDSFLLLEYLHYFFGCQHTEEEKYQAYASVLRAIMQLSMVNMHFIVLKYTLRYFQDNRLECLYNQKHFEAFMSRNDSTREPLRMRTLLIFVLLNAKKVLTTLVKIVLGYTDYKDILFTPQDMLMLQTFLCIKTDSRCNLLVGILMEVCMHDIDWDSKKFAKFIGVMLENQVMKADELMNNIYIPYLTNVSSQHHFSSILVFVYDTLTEKGCTYETNYMLLIMALAKRMSSIRRCHPDHLRSTVNNVVANVTRIILSPFYAWNLLTASQQREVYETIGDSLEPIDWTQLRHSVDHCMPELIRDYERRCLVIHRRLCSDPQVSPALRDYAHSFRLDREAFMRHMMLHATEQEFQRFALELTTVFWCHFGWAGELAAYENVLRITVEAARLALTFDEAFPSDSFVTLLRGLVAYCEVFANIKDVRDQKEIRRVLLRTLYFLREAVSRTRYDKVYDSLLKRASELFASQACSDIENYFHKIGQWIEIYLVRCETLISPQRESASCSSEAGKTEGSCEEDLGLMGSNSNSNEFDNMFAAYKFVCACINISSTDIHRCTEGIRDIILNK